MQYRVFGFHSVGCSAYFFVLGYRVFCFIILSDAINTKSSQLLSLELCMEEAPSVYSKPHDTRRWLCVLTHQPFLLPLGLLVFFR